MPTHAKFNTKIRLDEYLARICDVYQVSCMRLDAVSD